MKKIIIENDTIAIRKSKDEDYSSSEILADLLCATSAVAKEVGISEETLLDCLMTVWHESED